MAFLKSVLILSLVTMALSCSPPEGWKSKPMMDRVEESKLLVYGKVSSRTETPRNGGTINDIRYDIEVYCVLKKEGITKEIGATLSIDDTEPPLCVSNKEVMTEDSKIIVMLQEHDNKFMFHNINVQRAVFEGNEANLATIVEKCQATKMYAPSASSSSTKCPKVEASRTKACNSCAFVSYAMKLLVFCISMVLFINKRDL